MSRVQRFLLVLLAVCVGLALATKDCPNCGAANRDDARFCKSCGYRFTQPSGPGTRSLPQVRAQVSIRPGAVEIGSTPSGAAVQIDGRQVGITPLELVLSPGQHELTLSKSGYRAYSGELLVPEVRGTIVVRTRPSGAEVTLDGKVQGVAGDTGLTLGGLSLEQHVVRAELLGYQEEERAVELSTDHPVSVVTLEFRVRHGVLSVNSVPSGAAFSIDGRAAGKTPYIGARVPARYRLGLARRGFEEWFGYADVRPGETTHVDAVLAKVRTKRPALLWLGAASLGGGIAAVVMGELKYAEYRDAEPPEYSSDEIAGLREATKTWDLVRDIGLGVGALSIGFYFAF